MKDRYSFIAPFYSFLAKLVFGNDLKVLKTVFAENLYQKKVLIIGGGDGLEYRDFQAELDGQFWEISASMLRKAKKNLAGSRLTYHLGQFQPDPKQRFDEVWLHFVLDTLLDEDLELLILKIKNALNPNSRIYLADFFEPQTQFQQVIHWIMVGFFRVFTQHPRTDVPDYKALFQKTGFRKLEEMKKRKGWIGAQLWGIASN